jgi:hypothetical protein
MSQVRRLSEWRPVAHSAAQRRTAVTSINSALDKENTAQFDDSDNYPVPRQILMSINSARGTLFPTDIGRALSLRSDSW